MSGTIYLLQDDGTLAAMTEQPYANESRLQSLLADYPDLLAGEQMDEQSPRRWLLVSREVGIPLVEDGGNAMSLDHLFLDQDGIPTLVEVKRSSDTRIRREVVGQMLDYAAHAMAYWTDETIRSRYQERCLSEGLDADASLIEFLKSAVDDESGAAVEAYWDRVKTNLLAGRIRLVFVADQIPAELRRIVEFLNRFTNPVEVLAVEVPQFAGEGLRTLVPRVIGQTSETQTRKRSSSARGERWTEERFYAKMAEYGLDAEAQVARKIGAWAESRAARLRWGTGVVDGSFVPLPVTGDVEWSLFAVYTNGQVDVSFGNYVKYPPFDRQDMRLKLRDRLNDIEGVAIERNRIDKYPKIPLSILGTRDNLDQFLAAFDWFIEQAEGWYRREQ